MKFILLLVSFFLCLHHYSCEENYKLKQLIVIARHADKKPTSYPNDPYFQYWNRVSLRKLTKNGIRRSYHVGQELIKEYKTFLSKDTRDIYARAQDSDVCLETVETILAAMFPPQGERIWNEQLLWQPIAVHSKPIIDDNELSVFPPCPTADAARDRNLESKQVQDFLKSEEEFLRNVTEKSGFEINSLIAAAALYDTLLMEKEMGLILPSWVTDEVLQHLRKFADVYTTAYSQPIEIKRLRAGPLLKLIRDKLEQNTLAYLEFLIKKFNIYGTQGQIIANLLSALNVFNGLAPPTSAVIIFELFESSINQYFVKSSYFNETSINDRQTLYLPECYYQEMCPLKMFIEIVDKIIPDDWAKECKLGENENGASFPNIPGGLPNIPFFPFPIGNNTGFPLIPGFTPAFTNTTAQQTTTLSPKDILNLLNSSGVFNTSGLHNFQNISSNRDLPKFPNIPGIPRRTDKSKQSNNNRSPIIGVVTKKSTKKGKQSKLVNLLPKNSKSSKSNSKKSKKNKPKFPYSPKQQSNSLKSSEPKPELTEGNKAILIIPALGYTMLGCMILMLIFGVIYFTFKISRRSQYSII